MSTYVGTLSEKFLYRWKKDTKRVSWKWKHLTKSGDRFLQPRCSCVFRSCFAAVITRIVNSFILLAHANSVTLFCVSKSCQWDAFFFPYRSHDLLSSCLTSLRKTCFVKLVPASTKDRLNKILEEMTQQLLLRLVFGNQRSFFLFQQCVGGIIPRGFASNPPFCFSCCLWQRDENLARKLE